MPCNEIQEEEKKNQQKTELYFAQLVINGQTNKIHKF